MAGQNGTRQHGKRNGHKPDDLAEASGLMAEASVKAGAYQGGLLDDAGAVREGQFRTARGQVIEINGVSPWLLEGLAAGLRAEWAEQERGSLEAPTYDIPLPGGETETRAHDTTTLKTDEDRAEWAAYQARVEAFQVELQARTMRVILIRGVRTKAPDGGDWEIEQRFMGIRIPTDAMERQYHWLRTEVINSPIELAGLMSAVLGLSGIRGEALAAAEAAFRDSMEGAERPETSGPGVKGRRLVSKPDVSRGGRRAGLGSKA